MSAAAVNDEQARLWALMQRIELCRHRAELAELSSQFGPAAYRRQMIALAEQWRLCAEHVELLERTCQPLWSEGRARSVLPDLRA